MTKKQVKDTFYNLTRFYGMARKIGSYIVRDCLTEVFSVCCPTQICRDAEAFVITYTNKPNKLEYWIRKNVINNTCYVTQIDYVGSDMSEIDTYVVHFPEDTELFKGKVAYDTDKFYERK